MMTWTVVDNVDIENELGLIPYMLDPERKDRTAVEQLADNYSGGWNPLPGFTFDAKTGKLSYPGDPPMLPLAWTIFRDERVLIYPYGWVLVANEDGSHFEASRMD